MTYEGAWNSFWENTAKVKVPEGAEKDFICKLESEESIKKAGLNLK